MNRASAPVAPLVALVVSALSSSALAGSPVGLAYEAPDGCPAQRDFVAAVAARGAEFDGPGSAGASRVMVVAIRKNAGGFSGAFQVRDEQAASNKREVHGPSCGEVVDALAVVTAIALRSDVVARRGAGRGRHAAGGAAAAPPLNGRDPGSRPPKIGFGRPPDSSRRGPKRCRSARERSVSTYNGTSRCQPEPSWV